MRPKPNTNKPQPSTDSPAPYIPHFVVHRSLDFNRPGFTIKDLKSIINISSRKLQDWDEKKIISRPTEDGKWHKFSLMDFLKFQIIADLKEFGGFKAKRISEVFSEIINFPIFSLGPEMYAAPPIRLDIPPLEYFYTLCGNGEKYVLIIHSDYKINFITELKFMETVKDFSSPFLMLPFFAYVKKIHDFLEVEIDEDEWTSLKKYRDFVKLSVKELRIINLLRNDDFSEININRNGSDTTIVRARIYERGKLTIEDVINAIAKRDYQNVRVSRSDGDVVSISREEIYKL
jgi:hypothetical protein